MFQFLFSFFHFSIFFLLFTVELANCKCDSNAFCYSPSTENVNITLSCNKLEDVLSLKWKTNQKTSLVRIKNGKKSSIEFSCGFSSVSVSNPLIDVKSSKFEILKNENLTSCQFDFYNTLFFQNDPTNLEWNNIQSEMFKLHSICNRKMEGMGKEIKRLLVKIHAILMIFGWLFLIPTGFLFARFGKDLFSDHKLIGMPIWFQIHRTSTFIGVLCISISIFCIFISTNWTWKGTGSNAWYWTQWHTDFGTISSVLAVSQPFNSLLRCPPSNSRRSYFNWAHRMVGIFSYTFAVAAIYVAAVNYRKTWSEPVMEVLLTTVPTCLCLTTALGIWYAEKRNKNGYEEVEMIDKTSVPFKGKSPQIFRTSWLFLVVGTCLGAATSLSLLIANGFKTG